MVVVAGGSAENGRAFMIDRFYSQNCCRTGIFSQSINRREYCDLRPL
jgi:hypothetical protein